MRLARLSLLCIFAVVLALGLPKERATGSDRPPRTFTDLERIRDTLLPTGFLPIGKFPLDARWIATVLISAPFEKPEYRISLTRKYDGSVVALIAVPQNESVLSQLRKLDKERPGLSDAELAKGVKLLHAEVNSQNARRLTSLADELEKIRFNAVLPDILFLDAPAYEFWIESLYGARLELVLYGPGRGARKQPHPLLDWAEKLRTFAEENLPPVQRAP